jgi:serine/threonine protein kinase
VLCWQCDLCAQTDGFVLDPLSMVVEFAANGSLDAYLDKSEGRQLALRARLEILLGCARGVDHLHAEEVVHRDLAARNILLAGDLTPKVSDFGMARDIGGEESNETRTRVGPIKWMGETHAVRS